jgi:hypothetical protein
MIRLFPRQLAEKTVLNGLIIGCLLCAACFFSAFGLWHIQFYAPRNVEIHGVDGWLPWGIIALGFIFIVVGQGCLWLFFWLFMAA